MAHTPNWLALGLVVLVTLLAAGPAAAGDGCAFFTGCTDCVCRQDQYQIYDVCDTGYCAWNMLLKRCQSATLGGNSSEVVRTLWNINGLTDDTSMNDDEAVTAIEHGDMNCPIQYGAGTRAVSIVMLAAAVVFLIVMVCLRFRKTVDPTGEELLQDLFNHIPATDVVQWKGISKAKRPLPNCCFRSLYTAMWLALVLPSFLWLVTGLPYAITSMWGFNFYFSVFFPVGFMGFLWGVTQLILCFNHGVRVSAYALTDKRAVIIRGIVRSEGTVTSQVLSVVVNKISQVAGTHDMVSFVTDSSTSTGGYSLQSNTGPVNVNASGTTIRFTGLKDSQPIFMLLQARASGQRIVPMAPPQIQQHPQRYMGIETEREDVPLASAPPSTAKYNSMGV